MATPVVIVASGGLPVVESDRGFPATIADNGFGIPVTYANSGTPISTEGVWSPSILGSDLIAWWDASFGLSLSSGKVTAWADRVHAYILAQSVDANRPAYSATSFNGGPGVTADGTTDYLDSTDAALLAALPTGASPVELWAIWQDQSTPGDGVARRIIAYGGDSNNTSRSMRRDGASGINRMQTYVGSGASEVGQSNGAVNIANRRVLRGVISATAVRSYVDGEASAAGAAVVPATGTEWMRLFAPTTDVVSTGRAQGVLRDVLITRPLSDAQAAELLRWSIRRRGLDGIWLDGDSYSAPSTGGDGLAARLSTAGRIATVTGVGGSTLDQAVARVQARPWARDSVLIIWDGSSNGYGTLAEDMAKYAAIASFVPKTIILPPVRRGVDDAGTKAAITALQGAIATAYAGRTIDAQALLAAAATSPGDDADVAAGVVPSSLLVNPVTDAHLNTAGWNVVYPAVAALLTSLGW